MSDISYKLYPNKQATIIKAPFSGGQGKKGVELGPDHLIKHGLISDVNQLGWSTDIKEPFKDLDSTETNEVVNKCKNPTLVGTFTKKLYDTVLETYQDNKLPLTVGGDHSIGMATISAFIKRFPNGGILWIDAHADINTPTTSGSGNLHGCPVAFSMGLERESWPGSHFDWLDETTVLKPNQIVYIGLRDVDEGEKKLLRDLRIKAYTMYHVDKYGISKVVEMALNDLSNNGDIKDQPIHVSYDVDAMDPLYVPATGTPVRGGLTLREGLFIVEAVAESGNLAGLDIVEVNPLLASHDIHVLDTVSAGCAVARCALGETII